MADASQTHTGQFSGTSQQYQLQFLLDSLTFSTSSGDHRKSASTAQLYQTVTVWQTCPHERHSLKSTLRNHDSNWLSSKARCQKEKSVRMEFILHLKPSCPKLPHSKPCLASPAAFEPPAWSTLLWQHSSF